MDNLFFFYPRNVFYTGRYTYRSELRSRVCVSVCVYMIMCACDRVEKTSFVHNNRQLSENSSVFEEHETTKVGELATREAVDIRQQIPVVACVCVCV